MQKLGEWQQKMAVEEFVEGKYMCCYDTREEERDEIAITPCRVVP